MFNWLKKTSLAAKEPPEPDGTATQSDNSITTFAISESEALKNQGNIYLNNGKLEEAAECYQRAIECNSNYAEAYSNLGYVLETQGNLEEAVALYRQALVIKPDLAAAHSNLAATLMELGKMDEAEKYLSKTIELAPGEAFLLAELLALIPYRQDDPRFNQLEAVYSRRESLPMEERIKLNFAMGKAMEDIGQYDRAFCAYEEGNHLHYQRIPFDEATCDHYLEKTCNIFTSDILKKCVALSETIPVIQDKRVPIFIVGMPRSGTTLIEQVLASHPAIFGAGELEILSEVARQAELLSLELPDLETTQSALRKLGQEYLDHVWKLAPDACYITDKMPGNYQYLGLINLMLPNAKIIHAMRDPMDTCFSCYSHRFAHGHEYSYDLGALGRQYLRYATLMHHWQNVLPKGRILDVRYEDNVIDLEREARRMLDFIGLPWNPACLKFFKNKRAVHTASVNQVRKPIYSSSVDHWKSFKKHLSPLLEIIQTAQATADVPISKLAKFRLGSNLTSREVQFVEENSAK